MASHKSQLVLIAEHQRQAVPCDVCSIAKYCCDTHVNCKPIRGQALLAGCEQDQAELAQIQGCSASRALQYVHNQHMTSDTQTDLHSTKRSCVECQLPDTTDAEGCGCACCT